MEIEENPESKPTIIPLKDKKNREEEKKINLEEEKKEGKVTDLLFVSKYNYLNGKKTYWSQDVELDSILNQYKRIHILDKNSLKRAKWSCEEDKVFTPAPVTSIPKNIDINTFENLLRKKKLAEIEKKISTGNFIDEEVDNDKDLRTPSPEPIYDPKSGLRLNTRELRNKEKFLKQKNLLITELVEFDGNYKPPKGYKPPKKTQKIYISNNEKYYFTRYLLGPKGENLKKIQKETNCKITIKGEGAGWTNNNQNQNKPKESLHLLVEADNEEVLQKGINTLLPYLNENSQEYKAAKLALITQINVNNNEWCCEICGEKGHKSWACPLNINQYKAEVVCQYCGDKGHPSMDCPFIENLKNKATIEENSNKKNNSSIQNSILFKGVQKNNNNKDGKIGNSDNKETKALFGTYEESLVNNYVKFLAANANKNKLLQKKYYRNPSSTVSGDIKEGESVNYDYYAAAQSQTNNNINLNDNKEKREDK